MKIAAAQFAPAWEDKQENFERVRKIARMAAERDVDWLVLPEMFATGFSMDTQVTAEPDGGVTTKLLVDLAIDFRMGIIGGLVVEGEGGRGLNLALAIGPDGREVGRYAKTHLIGLLGEVDAHQPGDGPVIFDLGDFKAACFVCYDLRFPELFRKVADQVELFVIIASWPDGRQRHWDLFLPARAVENLAYVVGVNRVGEGGGLTYQGGTAIYDPMGDCLAFGGDKADLVIADLDPERVGQVRSELPFLRDRRF